MSSVRAILPQSAPEPKVSAVIRKSKLWIETVRMIEAGEYSVEVNAGGILGLKDPTAAFHRNMQRYLGKRHPGKYDVYVSDGMVYVRKRKKVK